jgi:uncharacterized iron-regulated membrane protein
MNEMRAPPQASAATPLLRPTLGRRRGASDAVVKHGKRWLYLIHRWVGIFTCLFCAMWFFSGVVMMYVPFPSLGEQDRMVLAEPVDFAAVAVSPDAAMARAGLKTWPESLKLTALEGEPVWRMVAGKKRATIAATNGRTLGLTGPDDALRIVRRLRPEASGASVTTLARDQWTVAQTFEPHRPLHRVDLHDAAGTQLYVSSHTGEVVLDTQRTERFWNWLGAVPHWLYFTVIRSDGKLWRQVVMWSSGPAILGAIAGIWVGILRVRVRRRYAQGRISPYRGWMKWHHVTGLAAGLFVVTWLFSGWLSVNPFQLFNRTPASKLGTLRYMAGPAASGEALPPRFSADAAPLQRLPGQDAREARFVWFDGRPLLVLQGVDRQERLYDARTAAPVRLRDAEIFAAAARLAPEGPVASVTRLTQEDAYWYSHHNQRRMPVLRVKFADPAQTWVHIDPNTGQVLGRANASSRTYRWLFNALHSFDFRMLTQHRPLWDVVVWALSIGGFVISVSGVVVGWRRLKRKATPPQRKTSRRRAAT